MARPRNHMTPAQKQWDTINNINANYTDHGAETQRVRAARIMTAKLGYTLEMLADPNGNYARLGVADMHTDVLQRLETLLAAVKAAGEQGE